MIEVTITPELYYKAQYKSSIMGSLNNSITSGEGNVAGFIGEYIVADYIDAEVVDTYDYDLLKKDIRIDVKTKRCTSPPKLNYDCSICGLNPNQKCDEYWFVRILNDYSKAWILGWYPKKEYIEDARLYKKGDIDGKFTFHTDAYNIPISKLFTNSPQS